MKLQGAKLYVQDLLARANSRSRWLVASHDKNFFLIFRPEFFGGTYSFFNLHINLIFFFVYSKLDFPIPIFIQTFYIGATKGCIRVLSTPCF